MRTLIILILLSTCATFAQNRYPYMATDSMRTFTPANPYVKGKYQYADSTRMADSVNAIHWNGVKHAPGNLTGTFQIFDGTKKNWMHTFVFIEGLLQSYTYAVLAGRYGYCYGYNYGVGL